MKNFEKYALGTKVQSLDNYGYYVMSASGIIVKHLGGGHAIIKTFNGEYHSTVGKHNIHEVEVLA